MFSPALSLVSPGTASKALQSRANETETQKNGLLVAILFSCEENTATLQEIVFSATENTCKSFS